MTAGWRYSAGVTIFVIGFAAPLAIPLVTGSDLPTGWKTAISGALAVGVPEVMMVVAAAVMGKAGFAELKRRIGVFFRRYGPPDEVSPTRYRVGLVMFATPIVVAFVWPYLHLGDLAPGFETHPMLWVVGGDLLFFSSLLVLGGDFWDKLRSLFVHGAKAVFPPEEAP